MTHAPQGDATLLGIYLNDHLATFSLAADLAGRAAAGQRELPTGDDLKRVAAEVAEDRRALREVMRSLEVPERQYKVLLARAAERVGRLKPNGHLRSRSPLSNVVEAEGLAAAITANAACWRTLRELAETDDRLDVDRLRTLLDRAQRQVDTVDGCRRQAVVDALGAATRPAPAPDAALEAAAEKASAEKTAEPTPEADEVPAHSDLPLPDYDHLPTGSLASRIRALDATGLDQLLAYERAHANRVQVVLILEHRREELAGGATPTSGDVTATRPEVSTTPRS